MPRSNKSSPSHPDLFGNNADIIVNSLLSAIRQQNLYETEQLLKRLSREYPHHSRLSGFQQLLQAQKKLKTPVEDIQHDLNELRDIIHPLASKLLGTEAPGYLAPLWQRLAQALTGQRFDSENPQRHCSFVYSKALDWVGVREAIESESDWYQYPALAVRLAKALYFLNELENATEIWFYLFWQFPAEAEAAIEDSENPNVTLRNRWHIFEDMADQMKPTSFPAWMLLTDSRLIDYSFNYHLPVSSIHGKNYHALQQLLLLKLSNMKKTRELDLRKLLKQTEPKLLKWYLKNKPKL